MKNEFSETPQDPFKKSPLDNDQDAVLQDYKLSYALNRKSEEALHMFFSPQRIPVGLTDLEVQICVSLYPLRKAQADRKMSPPELDAYEDSFQKLGKAVIRHSRPLELPPEFDPRKAMTRSLFRRAIFKFLEQVHT